MFKTVSIRAETDAEWSRRRFLAAATKAAGAALLASRAGLQAATLTTSTAKNDLCFVSASTLAKMIRARQVSSAEVVQAFLDRIATVNPKINAAVYVAEKEAMAKAREADAALAKGETWGPLHGVPVSIKDCYEVAGMPTTNGAPGLKDYVSTTDAVVVERMKKAGAIVLAKTNVPFLCWWFESSNLLHGRTSNPYDLERTAGGSSGGEAAMLAAGASPLGIGGDSGGSIRVPSHWCGIAGIYPSWGRVPVAGCHPPVAENKGPHFMSAGPMARYVEDLALALPLLSGPDCRDAFSFNVPLRSPQDVQLAELRVAFFTQWVNEYGEAVSPSTETVKAVEQAATTLGQCGAIVEEKRPPNAEKADRIGVAVDLTEEFVATMRGDLKKYKADNDPLALAVLGWVDEWLAKTPPADREKFRARLPELRTSFLKFMEDHDVLLMPVMLRPAPGHGASFAKENLDGGYPGYVNLVGSLPAGTVRCGTSPEGLPIGVMVVGARWREDIVLAVLAHFESVFGGWQRPPI